ncbi:hypothetical protein [Thalassotalea sediminis]|uniref:hypothetical protein n=1 Tax=Thalassotalea sediminis TaxID=1759089 RepID=UPI00257454B6|nr:hypothetical protein [Thalassotalea sediminis]
MTINDEILTAANKLANQGIKPTVALIKTKLNTPVPLPRIISTLKTWQHEPTFTEVNTTLPPIKQVNDNILAEQLQHAITEAIAPLKKEVLTLQKEILQLKAIIQKDD